MARAGGRPSRSGDAHERFNYCHPRVQRAARFHKANPRGRATACGTSCHLFKGFMQLEAALACAAGLRRGGGWRRRRYIDWQYRQSRASSTMGDSLLCDILSLTVEDGVDDSYASGDSGYKSPIPFHGSLGAKASATCGLARVVPGCCGLRRSRVVRPAE